jgi:phosphoribosylformylglycinamidine cyclo-ligase
VASETGYVIDQLIEPQPIFSVIQQRGQVDDAEMFRVYNLGTGFCVVVDPADARRVREIATAHGRRAGVIGYTVHDSQRRVWIPQRGLVGQGTTFKRTGESPPA